MVGRGGQPIYLATAALLALGVLRLVGHYRRARRLLVTASAADRRTGRRTLDRVAAGYGLVLLAGAVVGLATRSLAWGLGVLVVLSVGSLLVTVVGLLVAGRRDRRRGPGAG